MQIECKQVICKEGYLEVRRTMYSTYKRSPNLKMSAWNVLWTTWDAFWQETSISGVNNAGKARTSNIRRICWIIVFIAGAIATTLSMRIVVNEYFGYPVTTAITIEHRDKVHFHLSAIYGRNRNPSHQLLLNFR